MQGISKELWTSCVKYSRHFSFFLFFAQSQVEFIAVIKAQLPLTWPGLCLHQDQDLGGGGGYRGRGSSCACALMRRLSAVKSERHTWQPTSKKAQLKPLPYCKAHIKMKSIKKFLVWIRPENSSDIWEQQKKGGSTAFKWFPQIIHENKAVCQKKKFSESDGDS